ncbi:phospholipase D-like domain-containing protein [Sphingomonas prati]|uniref:Phospholipase D n=1 Tax=Sphingomonas prati TaxID=1843237 RepID=A0A7W9BUA0_9SPHN|nr:phosphatidylserine/phosphatidylglycerophosphate/cardiolipin synthase family protein [Sphingomonas prati]MBB5730245.1 cardiolipin synthase [Sphingomonas prati]GGE92656.1 major cardiolipin synthase ClsA [Sphingomonas prati]
MTEDRPTFTVDGDRLTLLPDGPERLEALIALIDGAARTLRLLYYIYADDRAGRAVRDALVRAAQRGVQVDMIVDGFGDAAGAGFFEALVAAGGGVCRYEARFGRRYLLRNHQKLALADEARALIGGFNVEDDYFGTVADGAWRDLGLLVEGDAAARLAGYYDALLGWTRAPAGKFRDLRTILKRHSETHPGGRLRWLFGGPTRRLSPWALVVKWDMARARRLDMIAAYFAPNPAMLRRIERIVKRGGQATVMTAGKSDNNATIAATRHCYQRLLKRGVGVLEYGATKLHSKLFVIDDVVHIGSANFDVRSLYLNLEMMLRIEDPAFAAHMRAYFAGEAAESHVVTMAEHDQVGWFRRVQWGVAYFIVAVIDGNVTRRLNFGVDGR